MKICKRSVLGLITKTLDPLGYKSLDIHLKILFQSLCKDKTMWDTDLCAGLLIKWKTIMSEESLFDKVQISYNLNC